MLARQVLCPRSPEKNTLEVCLVIEGLDRVARGHSLVLTSHPTPCIAEKGPPALNVNKPGPIHFYNIRAEPQGCLRSVWP